MPALRAPKGTFDLLPPESEQVLALRAALTAPVRSAGYRYAETPTFEDTALFTRAVGESTDVVTKEMYSFLDRGGRSLSLRPEGTAGLVRALLERGLTGRPLPVKLWYSGTFYRYERPQAGRYRHFSQVGAEAVGVSDPALDAELVSLAVTAFRDLGLRRFRVLLNSLGDSRCRPAYRQKLQAFLRGLDLDPETRNRVELNPLRVLDDKRPAVRAQLADAPLISDHLCADCRDYHDEVRRLLDEVGVGYQDDPTLVRGLDYYTRTTFTFDHAELGAQSEIGGGGRYDGLAEAIGGAPTPAVGWALGVDRTLLAVRSERVPAPAAPGPRVFLVPVGPAARPVLFRLLTDLRSGGLAADMAYGQRGLKGALRAADRSGAALLLLAGDRELASGVVQLKELATGQQRAVPLGEVAAVVRGSTG